MLARSFAFASFCACVVALFAAPASAQRCVSPADMVDDVAGERFCGVSLINTRLDGSPMGGTAGFGNDMSCLRQNDDGSSPSISITPYFPSGLRFFSMTHNSVFVNTNGNITFSAPVSTYTPRAFPVAAQPMIAPYWADVDIRGADGSCTESVGLTCSSCTPCQPFASDQVWWDFEPGRAVFTWDEVGYYNCQQDRRMSFQLILTAATATCGGAGDFDVEFRYNRCEWESGSASGGTGGFGGTAAQAGFDAGNSMDFVEIMNSRVNHMIARTLCEDSNVGMPGIWRFQIRSGAVICPDAGMACTLPGLMGACAMGRTNCVGGGTECVQQVFPEMEICDAIDNDCNGTVDDGTDEALCGVGFACRSGVCVEACFEGACPTGLVCSPGGRCVEPGCETITCPDGQRCSGGSCIPACMGVTCPYQQVCVEGRCIDPCFGVTCDSCSVCDAGSCVVRCDMGGSCAAGQTCMPDGSCAETACIGVSCSAGTHCAGGACVDSCTGVTCPAGRTCMAGECISVGLPDAGPGFDAGSTMGTDAGGTMGTDAGGTMDMDAGVPDVDADTRRPPPHTTGCACRTGGAGSRPLGGALLALGLAALLGLRRRRR